MLVFIPIVTNTAFLTKPGDMFLINLGRLWKGLNYGFDKIKSFP